MHPTDSSIVALKTELKRLADETEEKKVLREEALIQEHMKALPAFLLEAARSGEVWVELPNYYRIAARRLGFKVGDRGYLDFREL